MSYNRDTGMYEGYIYKIYNDINDKLYIGQTIRNINVRFAAHKSASKHQNDSLPIHSAIYKYGVDVFHIELLEIIQLVTKQELKKVLNEKEILYISRYNCITPNGYNISAGGAGIKDVNCREVVSCDPYTKEKYYYKSVNEAALYNNIPTSNVIVCCQGKKCSINNKIYKYKENGISQADIDNYFYLHPIIFQYDLFGNQIDTFISSTEASEFLKNNNNLKQSVHTISKNIMACCGGRSQTAYKYVWRKMNDTFDKYPLKVDCSRNDIKNTNKPIDVYTINGTFVGCFINIKEAFKALGLKDKQTNQALRCCMGLAVMAFNYIWRFHGEHFNKYSCAIINGTIRVNKYTLDGEFIATYMNYKYAAQSIGTTNKQAVASCCKTKQHNYKDFLWFHINDFEQPDKTKIIQ